MRYKLKGGITDERGEELRQSTPRLVRVNRPL